MKEFTLYPCNKNKTVHRHPFLFYIFFPFLGLFALPPTISVLSVCLFLPLIGNCVFAGGGVAILRKKNTVSHITSTLLPVFEMLLCPSLHMDH